MKQRNNEYKEIAFLPPGAMNVNALAQELGYSTGHIYKLFKLGQLHSKGWDIVIFQDYNFAIPLKK